MKYYPPYGSPDPNASYVDKDVPGAVRGSAVPAKAIEKPQRELVDFITKSGIIPDDVLQLAMAVQSGKVNFAGAAGTANALTATLDPAPASLTAGLRILLNVPSANTSGTVTLNINGLGAIPVYRRNSDNLRPGDIRAGMSDFIYDGAAFRLMTAPFGNSTIGSSGWVDLAGGLTMQWGTGTTTSGRATVTFPKAFSAAPFSMCATDNGAGGWSNSNATFLGIGARTPITAEVRSVNWNGSTMSLTTALFFYMVIGPT
ncbi:hypothetical protein O9X90_07645 [Agrobacterium leguminum]|uniref:gp53-like domain-containing protein n=1 Tax=Agrobacterium leguminum TaxID=2792015 RepID=UPI0022B82520|nr:hypothetical protein [Agrobacterium leguminum]MCZ7932182.1 hypothetical protein [Agrobacterium leguminum]